MLVDTFRGSFIKKPLAFSNIFKESKISECYKRVPVPQDEYRVDKFAECENREIFFLQPQYPEYCSNKGEEGTKCIHIYENMFYNLAM